MARLMPTSYGPDLYQRIFGAMPSRRPHPGMANRANTQHGGRDCFGILTGGGQSARRVSWQRLSVRGLSGSAGSRHSCASPRAMLALPYADQQQGNAGRPGRCLRHPAEPRAEGDAVTMTAQPSRSKPCSAA